MGKGIRCGRVGVTSPSWCYVPVRPVASSNQGGVGTQSGHKDRNRLTKTKGCRHAPPLLTCKNVMNERGQARAAKILKGLIIRRPWVRVPPAPPRQVSDLRKRLSGAADSGLWANGLNPLLASSVVLRRP
ncbi:hypothetical protein Scel_84310 [Streptomyces cellostaticus]|nr:hypothetical protein Scel_01070 [Streptomyces cellostaticus]GHI10110.1 hypothetical protein Scel_84310 [Streptomyces cellostaticus]